MNTVLNIVATGGVLAVLACAYTLTFGVLRVINFAIADAFMLAPMLCVTLLPADVGVAGLGGALALAVVGAGFVGALSYWVVFHPLLRSADASPIVPLVASVGLSIATQNAVMVAVSSGSVPVGWAAGASFAPLALGVGLSCTAVAVGFARWLATSGLGRRARAVRDDAELAKLAGIAPGATGAWTFAWTYALAAAAGLAAATYAGVTRFDAGFTPGIKAFAAAIVGGIGDVPSAIAGGFFLAAAEALAARFLSSEYKDVVAFVLLVAALLWRPRGLTGRGMRL